MLSLLAALAFSQQTVPPELTLPIAKAVPIPERLAQTLPKAKSRDIRGCVVADDGSAIFWGRDDLSVIDVQAATYSKLEVFRETWQPESMPITSTQRAWVESHSHFDIAQPFVGAGRINIVQAKTKRAVFLEYDYDGKDPSRAAYGRLNLETSDTSRNAILQRPDKKGFYSDFVADLSADAPPQRYDDALLAQFFEEQGGMYRSAGYRYLSRGASEPVKAKIGPGIVPIAYDSLQDVIPCFTFTEEGTPYALLIEHVKTEQQGWQRVARPGGRVAGTGLLPKGRIVTTCLPFHDDEDDPKAPAWGIYQCDPPYTAFKYLGPYRVMGSSCNGQWLLIAHLKTQKTWLIAPSL